MMWGVLFYKRLVKAHGKFSKELRVNKYKMHIPSCKTRNEKAVKHDSYPGRTTSKVSLLSPFFWPVSSTIIDIIISLSWVLLA